MKVLFAYNQHRSGGGSNNTFRATIDVARAAGIEVEVFTRNSRDLPVNIWGRLRAGASAIYAPESVRSFTRRLDIFKPDLVHANELFPLVSPWILPECTRRAIPVVMSTDDYRLTCPVRTHLRRGRICTECVGGHEYRAILHNCRDSIPESIVFSMYNVMVRKLRLLSDHVTSFIAPSDFSRRWLIEHAQIQPARVGVLACIVDTPALAADPGQGAYVGFAGRFVPEKGIATFLEAARLTGLPFRLSRNEKSFAAVKLSGDVEVVVTRDREGLDAFYRGARMIVMPSLWFETFGLSAAEAMSHGIPVIGSRIGAIVELIDDGVDSLLFDPGDARDLAGKVSRLWNDPGLCRRMGAAARAKADRWKRTHHLEGLLAIYESALLKR